MRFLTLFALGLWAALPLRADEAAIQSVIDSQIEAFQNDDFEEAFTYAGPNIQRMFGSPARFGMMVRQGYPMVWRTDQIEYLELRSEAGRQVQEVLITDENGALHVLAYYMEQQGDAWVIAGVQVLRAPQVGA